MKRKMLAIAIAVAMATSCATTNGHKTPNELQAEGDAMKGGYAATKVVALEQVRQPINELFVFAAKEYQGYVDRLTRSPGIENVEAYLTSLKDEKEKKKAYEELDPEVRAKYDSFHRTSNEMLMNFGKTILKIASTEALLSRLDTSALLADVEYKDLMATKNALAYTQKQVAYMKDSLVAAYENHKVLSALASAE